MAPGLLNCLLDVPGWVVGGRGLASDAFREQIWNIGARQAIPPKRTDAPVACPPSIYANRHLVENPSARLKEWRAIVTLDWPQALMGPNSLAPVRAESDPAQTDCSYNNSKLYLDLIPDTSSGIDLPPE
ncbi:hypothetical protein [Siccirubricoccus soli]|uniref:hypothetical protein n=1 Tax=Siccirubricoccus soli TaxID=2899147 RepID=UPI0035160333